MRESLVCALVGDEKMGSFRISSNPLVGIENGLSSLRVSLWTRHRWIDGDVMFTVEVSQNNFVDSHGN